MCSDSNSSTLQVICPTSAEGPHFQVRGSYGLYETFLKELRSHGGTQANNTHDFSSAGFHRNRAEGTAQTRRDGGNSPFCSKGLGSGLMDVPGRDWTS